MVMDPLFYFSGTYNFSVLSSHWVESPNFGLSVGLCSIVCFFFLSFFFLFFFSFIFYFRYNKGEGGGGQGILFLTARDNLRV